MKKEKTKFKFDKILGYIRKHKEKLLFAFPVILAAALILFFLGIEFTLIITFCVIASSILLLSYFSVDYFFYEKVKAAEKNYPDFLEDLAESKSSGMTMYQAVKSCENGEYGELIPFIKKLNTLLSWGVPFNKAWKRFTKQLKDSMLIVRFNTIVSESINSGADTAAILSSLASRAGTIKSIDESRKSIIRQQVVMMYVLYFGFMGIIILLQKILLPTLYIQNIGSAGFSQIMETSSQTLDAPYFKQLFLFIILIQALSTGVLIGQILENKIIGGLKHIAILLFVGITVFIVVINPVSISVNQFVSNSNPYRSEEINIGGTINIDGAPGSNLDYKIIVPGQEPYLGTTGSQGTFTYTFEVPSKPGPYVVETRVMYNNKETVVKEYITVT